MLRTSLMSECIDARPLIVLCADTAAKRLIQTVRGAFGVQCGPARSATAAEICCVRQPRGYTSWRFPERHVFLEALLTDEVHMQTAPSNAAVGATDFGLCCAGSRKWVSIRTNHRIAGQGRLFEGRYPVFQHARGNR